jgi:hypothetical protein
MMRRGDRENKHKSTKQNITQEEQHTTCDRRESKEATTTQQ